MRTGSFFVLPVSLALARLVRNESQTFSADVDGSLSNGGTLSYKW